LAGQPYRNAEVRQEANELEKLNFLPDAIELRVRVSLITTSVENCSNNQLDVVYSVYTTQVAPVLSGTFESQKAEKVAPESSAGTAAVKNRWRFAPAVSYDRSERFAGGAAEYRGGGAVSLFSCRFFGIGLPRLNVDVRRQRGTRRLAIATASGWRSAIAAHPLERVEPNRPFQLMTESLGSSARGDHPASRNWQPAPFRRPV
jgi:hypothetical protein